MLNIFSGLVLQIGVNLDLDKLQFGGQNAPPGTTDTILVLSVVGASLAAIAISAIVYHRLQRAAKNEKRRRLEQEAFDKLCFSKGLDKNEQMALSILGGKGMVMRNKITTSRKLFEQKALELRNKEPQHKALEYTPGLREKLGFGYDNPDNEFTDTRMLARGTKLRCNITYAQKDLSYLTTVRKTSERFFIVNPPHYKGNPVKISRVKSLNFHINRADKIEFSFDCNVIGQSARSDHVIAVKHTENISSSILRNSARFMIDVPITIYVVPTNDPAASRRLSVKDAQYSVKGRVKDISMGGTLVAFNKGTARITEGDRILFNLVHFSFSDTLTAQVLRVREDSNGFHLNSCFYHLKELTNLKLNRMIRQLEKKQAEESHRNIEQESGKIIDQSITDSQL